MIFEAVYFAEILLSLLSHKGNQFWKHLVLFVCLLVLQRNPHFQSCYSRVPRQPSEPSVMSIIHRLALQGPQYFRCSELPNFSKPSSGADCAMVLISPFDKIQHCSDKKLQLNFWPSIKMTEMQFNIISGRCLVGSGFGIFIRVSGLEGGI